MFQSFDIIQRTKSEIEISLLTASAIFCLMSRSRIMTDHIPKEVDAWVIRCDFNRSRIVKRVANGEFKLVVAKSKPSKSAYLPKDTKNEHIRIYDQTDIEVASAPISFCHWIDIAS